MYMLENVPMDAAFRDRVPTETAGESAPRALPGSAWAYVAALGAAIGEAMIRGLGGYGADRDADDPLPPTAIPPLM